MLKVMVALTIFKCSAFAGGVKEPVLKMFKVMVALREGFKVCFAEFGIK